MLQQWRQALTLPRWWHGGYHTSDWSRMVQDSQQQQHLPSSPVFFGNSSGNRTLTHFFYTLLYCFLGDFNGFYTFLHLFGVALRWSTASSWVEESLHPTRVVRSSEISSPRPSRGIGQSINFYPLTYLILLSNIWSCGHFLDKLWRFSSTSDQITTGYPLCQDASMSARVEPVLCNFLTAIWIPPNSILSRLGLFRMKMITWLQDIARTSPVCASACTESLLCGRISLSNVKPRYALT